jgi:hypothetical protein
MPTIDKKVTTVLATMECAPADCDKLVRLTKERFLPGCAKQPGFVSASLHVSEKKDRLVTYFQWRSVADHLACQNPANWKDSGTEELWAYVKDGKVKLDAQVFEVAAIA